MNRIQYEYTQRWCKEGAPGRQICQGSSEDSHYFVQTESLDMHIDVYEEVVVRTVTLFSDIYQRVVNKGWISLTETISQIKTHGKLVSLPPITQSYLRDLQ